MRNKPHFRRNLRKNQTKLNDCDAEIKPMKLNVIFFDKHIGTVSDHI